MRRGGHRGVQHARVPDMLRSVSLRRVCFRLFDWFYLAMPCVKAEADRLIG